MTVPWVFLGQGMRKDRALIAIDIDGTLLIRGELNNQLVVSLRKMREEGHTLLLWSARGESYAQEVAETFNLTDLFHIIIAKPSLIIDDMGCESDNAWRKIEEED